MYSYVYVFFVNATAAVFAMIGVPLAAFAMAEVGSAMVSGSHDDDSMSIIKEPVTVAELRMMSRFGLENGDGDVDKAEFIILCMVRLGAADPALITAIANRFTELDISQDGTLSYKEICGYQDDAAVDENLQAYIDEVTNSRHHAAKRPSRRASAVGSGKPSAGRDGVIHKNPIQKEIFDML